MVVKNVICRDEGDVQMNLNYVVGMMPMEKMRK